jgi:hypothetical protein
LTLRAKRVSQFQAVHSRRNITPALRPDRFSGGAAPWRRRFGFSAMALNGQMWVLGGYNGSFLSDVWSSSSGATWAEATNSAPWSGRHDFGAVALNGQMWVRRRTRRLNTTASARHNDDPNNWTG